jgi:hypothetical protein
MKDILIDNKFIYNLEINFIKIFSIITKIILFLFIIGIFEEKPRNFIVINSIVKIMISLFLIYRFNKYRKKIIFTELDRKVIYSSALYIIIISFADIFQKFIHKIRSIIKDCIKYFISKINEIFYKTKNEENNLNYTY